MKGFEKQNPQEAPGRGITTLYHTTLRVIFIVLITIPSAYLILPTPFSPSVTTLKPKKTAVKYSYIINV